VDFQVLGPLKVLAADGTPIRLGGPRPRALLARLLLARGMVVSLDTLIEDLYGDAAPPSAQSTLLSFVSNLRRAIEPDRSRGERASVLVARPPGYLLAASEVDAERFTKLVHQAEFLAPREALAALDKALGMWRGSPYEEFSDEPWAVGEVGRLHELRLVAVERRAGALLDLGRPQSVIAELTAETVAHPLRERLWCLLALALYRTGRQGDALDMLRRAGQHLADELGLDPGPELRALEEGILRQIETLAPVTDAATLLAAQSSPLRLRGRDAQLAVLLALPMQSTRTGLTVGVIEGEPGIGKTRLLEAFDEHCGMRLDQLVLWGRCYDAAGTPALWPWTQVFEALERHHAPPDGQSLAGLLDGAPLDGAAEALLLRRNQAIAGWLAAASSERPLVIILDDLQWADQASLDLLRDLVMLVRGGAVTLLAACRNGMGDALGQVARYDMTRIRLTGLAPAAVRELAADLGVHLDEESALRMIDRTGGNPFFLRETLKSFTEDADEVPEAVTSLVRMRLEALGEVRRALAVAATIGREFDPAVVAEVIGEEAFDLLDRAVQAGLLLARNGRLAFIHDLVREAVVRDLPELRRAAIHRDVAMALSTRPGTDVAVIAHHAVQAGPAAYREAVRWAVAAAEQAERRLAYSESARWLGHAIEAHDASRGNPAEHVALLLRRVRALLAAGDPAGARQARAAAIRTADRAEGGSEVLVQALTALDTAAVWTLRDPYEAVELRLVHRFETALRELPRTDSPERALLLTGLAQELYDGTGDARADTLSAEAVAMARRLGDPGLLLRALNGRYLALPQPLRVPELMRIAAEIHGLSADAPAFELLACMLDAQNFLEMFDVAGADEAAAHCDALLERLPLPWPRFQHTLWRANRVALDGRFDAADALYADAEAQAADLKMWHAAKTVHTGRIALAYHRGAITEAAPIIEAMQGVHPTLEHDARILQLCAQGHLTEARALQAGLQAQPPIDWSWLSATCLRAAAMAALGHQSECHTLYRTLLPYCGRISGVSGIICTGPVDWYLALLATATDHHESATEHLVTLQRLAIENNLTWWHDRATEALRRPALLRPHPTAR
jgi:DNA-binding SARP family transcriptional activator